MLHANPYRARFVLLGVLLALAGHLWGQNKPDKPELIGIVEAVAADAQSVTIKFNAKGEAKRLTFKISNQTKLTFEKNAKAPRVGDAVEVWLVKDTSDQAAVLRFRTADKPAGTKPVGNTKNEILIQPERALKAYAAPTRDPRPVAAMLDDHVDRVLKSKSIPVSAPADDAEFLRRVTLDLTGRVPSYTRTVAFLASTDPDKRRNLVEDLLTSKAYGVHFATVWKNLIVARTQGGKDRAGRDPFGEWLAEQFESNKPWNTTVSDMLIAQGDLAKAPAGAFVMANAENAQPQPARLADSSARLFWGIQLRCAECHDHPFAQWKQTDFWSTAAFFSRVQNTARGGPATLTDSPTPVGKDKAPAGSIVIPATAKNAGKTVKARFLGGEEPHLPSDAPYRPVFAKWATAADNPYFARAAVNRWWVHFFGRGLVEPVDGFDDEAEASHPELLDKLAREFADSGFDLKHLCRAIINTKAYQRTSRPVIGNEDDTRALSHMAVKPLSPEAFYDSVMVVTGGGNGQATSESRSLFIQSFRPLPDSGAADGFQQGIPQILKLLNTPLLNQGAPVVNMLSQAGKSNSEAIDALYLAALSRRPTPAEVQILTPYLEKSSNPREAYAGVLWILLNGGEFALNH